MNLIDDKYEILEPLREGGMGAIYKVRHRLLDEVRVVKVMRPHASANTELRKRFVREAKMAIRVRHPNIGQLYDFSIDESGAAVIVMEFIDGVTLQDVLASGPVPSLPFVVDVSIQALQALACLHHNGIVHRDVSSDNVMLTRSYDGRPLVKLIDLGVAKDPGADATATTSGTFLGKARYAAPEQFRGGDDTPATAATDLYAFGVLLYELLTGRLPVEGSSFAELAAGHLFEAPIPFDRSDADRRVPSELREVVLQALSKDPARRIGSAQAFSEHLRAFGAEGGSDPLEFERLLERARAYAASRGPGVVSGEGPPGSDPASRARAARLATVLDAIEQPFLDPGGLDALEQIHGRRGTRTDRSAARATTGRGARTAPLDPFPVDASTIRESAPGGGSASEVLPRPRRAVEPRERSARGPWYWTALAAAAIFVLGAGGFVLWRTQSVPDPLAEQTRAVLALGEGTAAAVGVKLERVVALISLLPEGDDNRRAQLERERERLTNLQELYNYVERLEPLLADARSAAADPERARRAAKDAENLWILLREYRRQYADDDPAALAVERHGREILREIADATGIERLRELADEP